MLTIVAVIRVIAITINIIIIIITIIIIIIIIITCDVGEGCDKPWLFSARTTKM